jgi:hypothetical protein
METPSGGTTCMTMIRQDGWKQFIILSLTVTVVVAISMFLLYINYPNGHQYRFGFIAEPVYLLDQL